MNVNKNDGYSPLSEVIKDKIEFKIQSLKPAKEEVLYQCYDCENYLDNLNFDDEHKKKCLRNINTGALQVICKECREMEENE